MIKVLLIGPSTKEAITDTRWVTAPLGVHRIASFLKKYDIYVEVWDINIDNDSIETRINKKNWNIIGFSTLEATQEYDMSLIHLAKKLRPESILIAGGTGATLNYQEYFNKTPLNMVIQAEGEFALLQLCQMIEEDGYDYAPIHTISGIIIRNYAKVLTPEDYWNISKDLDVKSMKASQYWNKTSQLYDNPDYNEVNTFRLYTSNFCPMGCAFCTLSKLRNYSCGKHTPIVALTADQIIYIIKKVLKEYKDCRQIFLVDDDFFILKHRGIEFCNKVIELKAKGELPDYLRFICLTNINRIDESNIDLIVKAGFKVLSIGVESVSQHVLDSLDKKQTVERIWKTTELILSRGIKPYYTLLMFTSFCNFNDLLIDILGFKKLGQMGVGLSVEPYLIPLKGTRLSEEGVSERKRKVNIEGTNEFIYKGFAWLPQDPEVKRIFDEFEILYPKYRKIKMKESKGKHLEKNWQAYVIIDAVVLTIHKLYGPLADLEDYGLINNYKEILQRIDLIEECTVDTVGAIT